MTPLTQVLSPVQPVFPPALGSFSYVLMFFAAHFSSQSVSVPIMHSNSFVLPPKGLSFQYLPYSTLFSLISFLPSLILYKYLRVSPTFSPKFLFSVSVPVLTLPNFQTPSDLDQPKIPEVPVSPQPPENRPRPSTILVRRPTIAPSKTPSVVLESPVRSGYWPPSGSNRDRDRLVFSPKPKITGLNRYKPVTVG